MVHSCFILYFVNIFLSNHKFYFFYLMPCLLFIYYLSSYFSYSVDYVFQPRLTALKAIAITVSYHYYYYIILYL